MNTTQTPSDAQAPAGFTPLTLPTRFTIEGRLYRDTPREAGRPLVLFMHRGGFVGGGLPDADAPARALAEAGAAVLALSYPLAPEHPFPVALESLYEALRWAAQRAGSLSGAHAPLVVAGEEAGGNLAAALALMARDQQAPALAAQILAAPMLDPDLCSASLREHKAGSGGCPFALGWREYLQGSGHGASAADHPYAAPLASSRLAGAPRALLLTSLAHPLRDDTRLYAERLAAQGVPVAWLPADGFEHAGGTLRSFLHELRPTPSPVRRAHAPAA